MDKFIIIEVGSTNTKAYLYENETIKDLKRITIEFKRNYQQNNKIKEEDKDTLINFINSLDYEHIYVYGTSIFRSLSEEEKDSWLQEFKTRTNLEFNIVTSDDENEYTVYGAIANTNYKGKIAVMIGGGGSTELAITENGKIIESANSSFGVVDVTNMYPELREDLCHSPYNKMVNDTKKLVNKPKNNADILILAGGDFIYFYEQLKYPISKNNFYNNPLQPYMLDIKTMDKFDQDFFYHVSLDKVCRDTNDEGWWRGARGMRLCVKAIADVTKVKYIIPTSISMVYGLVEQIKKENLR